MGPIVHPTDFSAASRPAFAAAIEMAKATHSTLVVTHVLNPSMPPGDERRAHLSTHVRAISRGLADVGAQTSLAWWLVPGRHGSERCRSFARAPRWIRSFASRDRGGHR